MQGCREEEGGGAQSGTTPGRICGGDQEAERRDLDVTTAGDGATRATQVSDPEPSQEETLGGTETCSDDPPPTEAETTPPVLSLHPSNTPDGPSEPCWYCLRSLDQDYLPQAQQDSDPLSSLPPGGQKMNYQTDPRPHFGVAWSSHSTCRPLWGSEGPSWGQRSPDVDDQTHTCPHCHLGLPSDTLSWHETKCLLFDGFRSSSK